MDKSPEAFRTISEVSEALETPAHVLRFWETRFPQIRPVKRAGGRRYYRPSDVALLFGIKRLLHEDGLTIRGVQKILREHGVRHVSGLNDEISAEEEALGAAMPGRLDHEPTSPDLAEAATAEALEAALAPPTGAEILYFPLDSTEAEEAATEEEAGTDPQDEVAVSEQPQDVAAEPPAEGVEAPPPSEAEDPAEDGDMAWQPDLFLTEEAPPAEEAAALNEALVPVEAATETDAPPLAEEGAAPEEDSSVFRGPTLAARLRALPRNPQNAARRRELLALAGRVVALRDRLAEARQHPDPEA